VFNGMIRRFRSRKGNKSLASQLFIPCFYLIYKIIEFLEGDVTITGEDARLMKGLTTTPTTVLEMLPERRTEPASLMIDSTKPIYPTLE
jgi:hypothetical protein